MKPVTNQDVCMNDLIMHNTTKEVFKVIEVWQIPYLQFTGVSENTHRIERHRFLPENFTLVSRRVNNPHELQAPSTDPRLPIPSFPIPDSSKPS